MSYIFCFLFVWYTYENSVPVKIDLPLIFLTCILWNCYILDYSRSYTFPWNFLVLLCQKISSEVTRWIKKKLRQEVKKFRSGTRNIGVGVVLMFPFSVFGDMTKNLNLSFCYQRKLQFGKTPKVNVINKYLVSSKSILDC